MKQTTTVTAGAFIGLEAEQVWDTHLAYEHLKACGEADTKRTAERRLNAQGLLPAELIEEALQDQLGRAPNRIVLAWAMEQARKRRDRVLFVQLSPLPSGKPCLHASDARGARFWVPLANVEWETVRTACVALQQHIGKPVALFPHGSLVASMRNAVEMHDIHFCVHVYQPVLPANLKLPRFDSMPAEAASELSPHLRRLEAESIHIIREAVAEAQNPAMLYSIGKDSGVMVHLARKAFFPSPPPFPLLHVDTRWKFKEMYLFRDFMARESGMDLLVHTNPEAIEKNINPFDHGSSLHTDITKTEGLKQALDTYKFDLVLGGARRDEEKSRAKERVYSFRDSKHRWDPKNQRPELWNVYNGKVKKGESIRVFPLSNWTELDIWQYIYLEQIPIVPLYFAAEREVIEKNGTLIMIDDERILEHLSDEEKARITKKMVRFRTLGCYPLTGAVESTALTLPEIIQEMLLTRTSERQGRVIDHDAAGSMEEKKRQGYF